MATSRPARAPRWEASAVRASRNSSLSAASITPARANAACAAPCAPTSEPVWPIAAAAPDRPLPALRTTTGFWAEAARAASAKRRPSRIPSEKIPMTPVVSSRAR